MSSNFVQLEAKYHRGWPWKVTPDYSEPALYALDWEAQLSTTLTPDSLAIWFSEKSVYRSIRSGKVHVGVSKDDDFVVVGVVGMSFRYFALDEGQR
jgi:hypothetical protein